MSRAVEHANPWLADGPVLLGVPPAARRSSQPAPARSPAHPAPAAAAAAGGPEATKARRLAAPGGASGQGAGGRRHAWEDGAGMGARDGAGRAGAGLPSDL